MSRIRVLDLAKELNLETKVAIVKLQDIGVQVKNHFNAISDIEADKLRVYVRSGKNPEKEAANKATSKVVIRRRVVESPVSGEASEPSALMDSQDAFANSSETVHSAHQAVRRTEEPLTAAASHGTADVTQLSTQQVAEAESRSASAENADTQAFPAAAASMPSSPESRVSKPEAATSDAPASAPPAATAQAGQDASTSGLPPQPQDGAQPMHSAPTSPGTTPMTSFPKASEAPRTQAPAVPLARPAVSAPSSDGATVARPAQPAPAPASAGSATIIRRAPTPTVGSSGTNVYTASGNLGSQDRRPYSSDRGAMPNRGGFGQERPGFGQERGGFGQDRSAGYQGGGRGGYSRDAQEGGYQRGGYSAGAQGGYQRPEGQRPAFGPNAVPREGSGEGAQMRQGFGPRPAGGFPSGPGGGPRPGGFGPRADGAGPRPGGFGPRPGGPGGAPGGISRGGAFVMPDATPGKEGPSRTREKEKEHELRRRRLQEEEEQRRAGKLKGRHQGDEEFTEDELLDELGAAPEGATADTERPEVPQVRMMIPNRRKGSSAVARRKDHKRHEAPNPMKASKRVIRVDENISVSDLAAEMSVKSSALIKTLMKLGMMASVNQILDMETATLVAQEFDFEVQNATVSISDILAKKVASTDAEAVTRPPVITIMGHVDHGKTSLLDAIRSTDVASGEAGGITQHIGAYQIEYNGRKITFLDTPGHEAFTSMRARGAQVTDVVILVVAADDGVMPQTIEAISHAKAANVPIVVAVNKMDKAGANLERIQRELSTHQVTPEEWGGESMFVPVSAKTRQGLPELLEAILLQADVLDLKVQSDGLAAGIVIEAKLDRARGPVATLLVTNGTLKQADWVVAGRSYGRVRAIVDDKGQKLSEALPATPVEIIGLSEVPAAGDAFNCVVTDAIAKEAVAYRIEKQRQKDLASQQKTSIEDLLARLGDDANKAKELALIVKADTHGSVEAIRASLKKLDTEKVKTKIIHSAVGGITETDITLGQASDALVVGFNVRPDKVASASAEQNGVNIQCFSIIYELIDSVQNAMAGKLAPIKSEKVLGHAEVRNLFSVPKVGVIAGSAITDGKVTRNSHVRVVRDGIVIYTGRLSSLKRFKDDAKEVVQGFECGIGVENYNDLKVGDVIEAFVIEEVAATLH